jgi:hypothetical protein
MTTQNSLSMVKGALLCASLSIALISGARADNYSADSYGNNSYGHEAPRKTLQVANGIDLTQGGRTVATAGVLVRTPSEIEARLAMSGLEANGAYTIWWMIFNRPEKCAVKGACGPVDLTGSDGKPDAAKIRAVGGTVFNGTGFITASDGTANVSVHLKDGPLPVGNGVAAPEVAGYLWSGNGLNAYVITIIRAHGPAIPGKMATQISQVEPNVAQGGDCAGCFDHEAIIFGQAPRK